MDIAACYMLQAELQTLRYRHFPYQKANISKKMIYDIINDIKMFLRPFSSLSFFRFSIYLFFFFMRILSFLHAYSNVFGSNAKLS